MTAEQGQANKELHDRIVAMVECSLNIPVLTELGKMTSIFLANKKAIDRIAII